MCPAGTTLTHLGPFGNATQRQLDQALMEPIAHVHHLRYSSNVF
jgi:hypothetical protein